MTRITLVRFTAYAYHLDNNVVEVWINPVSVSRCQPRYVGAEHRQRVDGTRIFIGQDASVDVREDLATVVATLTGVPMDDDDDREPIQPGDYRYFETPRG